MQTDGPYGGDECDTTNHTHHDDLGDSIYRQTQMQAQFYSALRAQNIFINQPDSYFYQGGSKTGMGYNEVRIKSGLLEGILLHFVFQQDQYSLPRGEDITVSRQGMYDDTYHYIPTQGWMCVMNALNSCYGCDV